MASVLDAGFKVKFISFFLQLYNSRCFKAEFYLYNQNYFKPFEVFDYLLPKLLSDKMWYVLCKKTCSSNVFGIISKFYHIPHLANSIMHFNANSSLYPFKCSRKVNKFFKKRKFFSITASSILLNFLIIFLKILLLAVNNFRPRYIINIIWELLLYVL